MKLLIALHHRFELWNPPPWFAERLRDSLPQIEVVQLTDYEGIEKQIADADVVISWSLRPEQFLAAKKLRWIHSPAAAIHQLMIPEIVNSSVIVTNASRVHGPVVAEHAIAMLMALARCFPRAMRCQYKHAWGQQQLWDEAPRPREAFGSTLGLIGFGSIGGEVARRASALGMKIIAIREHPEMGCNSVAGSICLGQGAECQVLGPEKFEFMLSHSDYVVVAAPLTSRTQALFNADAFARMKPEAYLINVSRGALVDESALIDALRNHRIGGAALDVFQQEPLPADSTLWEMPDVLITPHSAAMTEKLWERHYQLFTENCRRYMAGEALMSVVDKRSGY